MKPLYTYNAPAEIRDEVMNTDSFYVPNTNVGIKTASFIDVATREEKAELFKEAEEDGNLASAFIRMKARADKKKDEKETPKEKPEKEEEDYGQASFLMNDKDDDDEEKDEDEEEKDEDDDEKKEKDEDEEEKDDEDDADDEDDDEEE